MILWQEDGHHPPRAGYSQTAQARAEEVIMQRVELSDVEQQVYVAVTALEARGQVPSPEAIADEAGLPEDQLTSPLHELAEKNLVHREDSPMEGLDFGPRWCAVQPA